MSLLLLVGLVSIPALFISAPLFLTSFWIILLTPIVAWLTGTVISSHPVNYLVAALVAGGSIMYIAGRRVPKLERLLDEITPLLIFGISFTVLHRLCLSWADFFPMGERLRDYAIIASVLEDPVTGEEPWLAGYRLNYYLYWYRFGDLIGSFLKLEPFEVYHILAAFPLSFLAATVFFHFKEIRGWSFSGALTAAIGTSFGANIAGVVFFFERGDHWWGPSRVIPGAINEFPAWSFLLGDVHPHYLNVGLVSFIVVTLCLILRSSLALTMKQILCGGGLIVVPLWLYNANAWEVPLWGGISVLLLLSAWFTDGKAAFMVSHKPRGEHNWVLIGGIFLLALSLYLSSRNILPAETPLTPVRRPIERTLLRDLFMHWGFPLGVITIGTLFFIRSWAFRYLAVLFLGGALLCEEAIVYLVLLLLFTFVRMLETYDRIDEPMTVGTRVRETVIISSVGLLILPELYFLNDPYGGENERMNTIFKVYIFTWPLLHIAAFDVIAEVYERFLKRFPIVPPVVAQGICLVCLCGFFCQVAAKLRPVGIPSNPTAEGLGKIDQDFPGARETIRALRELPRGIVLESQGDAYSYTSHVATLSGQPSFLGWANHVNLLLRAYEEIPRGRLEPRNFTPLRTVKENLRSCKRSR